jgi:dTDP-4-dehydrorhamnose reductase
MSRQVVAVTGASGRLGRALVDALVSRDIGVVPWSRPEYDLDDTRAALRVVDERRPDTVIHAAAWTAVDECALHPDLAMRRNASSVQELARACALHGVRFVLISTNEVFDGNRTDGLGYTETDDAAPINVYGTSKLAGERAALAEFGAVARPDDVVVVRTAWLFGPPGNDFPTKIIAAADRLPPDEPLSVVSDEVGSPTYTHDLAHAIVQLVAVGAPGGIYHLVNEGSASRFDVARRVLGLCRPGRKTAAISRNEFNRASTPPAWAVLRSTRPAAEAVTLRPWQEAIDAYVASLYVD